jgi:hypothetical protein
MHLKQLPLITFKHGLAKIKVISIMGLHPILSMQEQPFNI